MYLFRQINTPNPPGWEPGRYWFLEYYANTKLQTVLVVRETLSPPTITVKSVLSSGDHPPGVEEVETTLRRRWDKFTVQWAGDLRAAG